MTPERALEIVGAINDRAFFAMGIKETVRSLDGVSLAEMLEAKGIVEAGNRAAEKRQAEEGGSKTIYVVPDDRLIAAAYAIEHYHPDGTAIVLSPTTEWPFDRRVLCVFGFEPVQGTEEEEEE